MGRAAAVVLTALVGCLIALQAPVNSRLGRAVGTLGAATISFAIGTVVLALLALLAGGAGRLGALRGLPIGYLAGGVLGAGYVTCALVTVRTLGAGGVTAATIAGQLAMSVVIDRLGLLGVPRQPITLSRLAGIALLAAGTLLIIRR